MLATTCHFVYDIAYFRADIDKRNYTNSHMPRKSGIKALSQGNTDDSARPTQSQYESTIADLLQQFAIENSKRSQVDARNVDLESRYALACNDREDINEHIRRTIAAVAGKPAKLLQKCEFIRSDRLAMRDDFERRLSEGKKRFDRTQTMLKAVIKTRNERLHSLSDVQCEKDSLLAKFERDGEQLRRLQLDNGEEINDLNVANVIKNLNSKREIQTKITALMVELDQFASPRYAQVSIRLNIALNMEMDRMLITRQRLTEEHSQLMSAQRKQYIIDKTHACELDLISKLGSSRQQIVTGLTEKRDQMQEELCEKLSFQTVSRSVCVRSPAIVQAELEKKLVTLERLIPKYRKNNLENRQLISRSSATILNLEDTLSELRQNLLDEKGPDNVTETQMLLKELADKLLYQTAKIRDNYSSTTVDLSGLT